MYDAEKGYIVFKNQEEKDAWIRRCHSMAVSEYSTPDSFNKWKSDGERFLSKDFLSSPSFPILNDGRPELGEWLEGTLSTNVFRRTWDREMRLCRAHSLIKALLTNFAEQGDIDLEAFVCSSNNPFEPYILTLIALSNIILADKE